MPLIRKSASTTPPVTPAEPDFREQLKSTDPDLRWQAARGLSGDEGGVDALAEALASETSPMVREALFTSLSLCAADKSVATIIGFLRSDDAALRRGAMDALATMHEAVRPRLAELLRDADADVRLLACDLVRGLSPEDATGLLCECLDRETERNVCGAAIEVLAELGTHAAIPSLERCARRFAYDAYLAFAAREALSVITSIRPQHG